jgi:hypothetical protein
MFFNSTFNKRKTNNYRLSQQDLLAFLVVSYDEAFIAE